MTVADELSGVVSALVGPQPRIAIAFWDGSVTGSLDGGAVVHVRSPDALRHLLWAPNELGLGRAYVTGQIDIDGDIYAALALRRDAEDTEGTVNLDLGWRDRWRILRAARRVGALGRRPALPPEEARLSGRVHTRRRDAAAISHHYDVGNDFYRLVLGPSMTYSCAYWRTPDDGLDAAQAAKYELICRKLGLRPDQRLLDVGCGWGGMVLHAARHHGVEAVGITLSGQQAELARSRVTDEGLDDRIEIRVQDYRDVRDGPFDAISSIGMFEHVGGERLAEYLGCLQSLLRPTGRLLNHGISRPEGEGGFNRDGFISRYVFPDGELVEVGRVVSTMQDLGLEVRDVESLREHYALTLRAWVANLESAWDEAVALVGVRRARVWRLYMAASAVNFEDNRTSIHQILAVAPDETGRSAMPMTRAEFAAVEHTPA